MTAEHETAIGTLRGDDVAWPDHRRDPDAVRDALGQLVRTMRELVPRAPSTEIIPQRMEHETVETWVRAFQAGWVIGHRAGWADAATSAGVAAATIAAQRVSARAEM
jgi:hypothetical protein